MTIRWSDVHSCPQTVKPRNDLPQLSMSGDPPEELVVTGVTGDRDWVNGFYLVNGTHQEKPKYLKQCSGELQPVLYFHLFAQKWTIGREIPDTEFQHEDSDSSALTPPQGQWSTGSGGPGPTVSVVPQMLLVEGAGEDSNGTYVRCESHNDRPVFRQVGKKGTMKFNGTEWTIFRDDIAIATCHDHAPVSAWSNGASVSVFQTPFPTAPRFMWVQGAGRQRVNGCYACTHSCREKPRYVRVGGEGSIFVDDRVWKLGRDNFGWSWLYKTRDWAANHPVPPTSGWTNEDCPGEDPPPKLLPQHRYSEVALEAASTADSAPSSSEPPFLVVRGAGDQRYNGTYACVGTHNAAPKYQKVGGTAIMYYSENGSHSWRMYHENNTGSSCYEGSTDRTVLPTSSWVPRNAGPAPAPTVELADTEVLRAADSQTSPAPEVDSHAAADSNSDSGSDAPTRSASETPFLVVRGAGDARVNGRYAYVGTHSDAPKYRKVGGASIMFYESGLWRLNDEENTNQRHYDGPADRTVLPLNGWIDFSGRRAPVPTVCLGTHRDLQAGDEVTFAKGDGEVDWSNCPPYTPLSFSASWTLLVDRIEGDWWFSTRYQTLIAPLSALGFVKFNDQEHSILAAVRTNGMSANAPAADSNSEVESDSDSDSDAPTRSASETPFLVVRNAGDDDINGRYAYVGTHSDAPKYRKVGGTSIMFYESGLWRLNDEENTNQRHYDGPADRTVLPLNGWIDFSGRRAPVPTVCLGTHRDLQAGDHVKVTKPDRETDWSGCPQEDRFWYVAVPDSRTIDRIEGDWWFNTYSRRSISPLAVLGEVKFGGQWHNISAVERTVVSATASSSQAPPQQQEQVEEHGFDEEWCPDQDLERFQCCICMLVARNAMVHECGAALFCETCWVKCQQDSSNCPMCREDGSSTVPAHSDRRLIRNLTIMCPNKCGERMSLCEKDPSLPDMSFNAFVFFSWDSCNKPYCTRMYLVSAKAQVISSCRFT